MREATAEDLPQIIKLLAEDVLGSQREEYRLPLPSCYTDAFQSIAADKNNVLLVASDGKTITGCLQITFTQYLSHKGSIRATIENVRVASERRNLGIGTKLMQYAINLAKERGCSIVQLTTDKKRTDVHRFYKRFGFLDTHKGMKLPI